MKRLAAALLLAALMLPSVSLAYRETSGVEMTFPSMTSGTLTGEIRARTGPGTDYVTVGSTGSAGEILDVYSFTYDRSGTAWVQVSASVKGLPVRIYTELTHILLRDAACLSADSNFNEVVHTLRAAKPMLGPGYQYATYTFTLPKNSEVTVIQMEHDMNTEEYFTMCDFYYDGCKYRGWFPSDMIP